jgi:hypothetical protein
LVNLLPTADSHQRIEHVCRVPTADNSPLSLLREPFSAKQAAGMYTGEKLTESLWTFQASLCG